MNVEKLKNLYSSCRDKYAVAQEIGTTYQTLYNIIYKGSDFKVDLLQRIARYFKVPVGYFFDEIPLSDESVMEELKSLREENAQLKEQLACAMSQANSNKESEIYCLWMEHMRITERMQDLYESEKSSTNE